MAFGITYKKLESMLAFSKNHDIVYEVYAMSAKDTDTHWTWKSLTTDLLGEVKFGYIHIGNFRTRDSQYEMREPRLAPVTIYYARKTGKKYSHVKPIDLYKHDNSFNKK